MNNEVSVELEHDDFEVLNNLLSDRLVELKTEGMKFVDEAYYLRLSQLQGIMSGLADITEEYEEESDNKNIR